MRKKIGVLCFIVSLVISISAIGIAENSKTASLWSIDNSVLKIGDISLSIPNGYEVSDTSDFAVLLSDKEKTYGILAAFDAKKSYNMYSFEVYEDNIESVGTSGILDFFPDFHSFSLESVTKTKKDNFTLIYIKQNFKVNTFKFRSCSGLLYDNDKDQYYSIIVISPEDDNPQNIMQGLFDSISYSELNSSDGELVYEEAYKYAETIAQLIDYKEPKPVFGSIEKVQIDGKAYEVHSDFKYTMDVFYQFAELYYTDINYNGKYRNEYTNAGQYVLDAEKLKLSKGDKAYRDYTSYRMALLIMNR